VTFRRAAERLSVDRDDALALLAGRFRDELLEPRAEVVDPRRRDQGQLVAAARRAGAHDRAEDEARVVGRRHRGAAACAAASSRLLRGFFVLHPLVMALTVTATGNHYFVDSIAGASIALLALAVVAAARRLRARRQPLAEVIQLRPRSEQDEDARRAA
jgi:hypothetical protein